MYFHWADFGNLHSSEKTGKLFFGPFLAGPLGPLDFAPEICPERYATARHASKEELDYHLTFHNNGHFLNVNINVCYINTIRCNYR